MATGHAHDHSHRAHKGRIWTYLIFATGLVLVAVLANLALSNPQMASQGIDAIAGLPAWAFPAITGAVGLLIFYIGLKIETDWPERLGALLVAASIAGGEFLLGWQNFELGGLKVVPYVIPVVACLVLMMVANVKSR
ncbi:hypothetical protein OV203_32430 [Nannocystis sp. ILAH1]|uniref:hypothetical protein n=1 Tax=unclassified Nannocystis TaxID=2627009 RepID=UPI00226D8FBC|nr:MULTISPECIES: hypothetical protein [unclassified Nannocystis]MCY0991889.1 hypothetical protein [Nannocystis sp. ILAH1]MCY1064140.1 hypothetical protein [Nannocystis sp. RBIL2]